MQHVMFIVFKTAHILDDDLQGSCTINVSRVLQVLSDAEIKQCTKSMYVADFAAKWTGV